MPDPNSNQQSQGHQREIPDSENFAFEENVGESQEPKPQEGPSGPEPVQPVQENQTEFGPSQESLSESEKTEQDRFEKQGKSRSVQTKPAKAKDDQDDSESEKIAKMEKDQQVDVLVKMALIKDEIKAVKIAKKVFKDSPHYLDKFHDDLSLRKQG
ncbi:MAG: hypothetical protein GF335_01680 [Candidatus Moranbacteria bacterium]|nr:hypothetical protein [Candidatus Moranbacteria bacterium]